MLELYQIAGSPYGWRVQLALEHKRVPHHVKLLSLANSDTHAPAYLALNPRGKAPTLVDRDVVIYESLAILAYLEAKWPAPPLLGTTPAETGHIWRVIAEFVAYLDSAAEAFILPLYFGQTAGKTDALNQAARTIHDELGRLAAQLERTPWLAGDAMTMADFVVLPHLQSIMRAAGKPGASELTLPFLPLAPSLEDWRARIEALPYYAATLPPHWRPAPS